MAEPYAHGAPEGGRLSKFNTTSELLGSGEVFTGKPEDVSRWSSILIGVQSDKAGSLALQFSDEGETWYTSETQAVAAATFLSFSRPPALQFFRLIYTNGADAQGAFLLQTQLRGSAVAINTDGGVAEIGGDVEVLDPVTISGSVTTDGLTDVELRATPVLTQLDGGIDANSTSTVALGAGGVFTGAASDTSRWAAVIVTIHTDQASATDGLEIQWSPNNSTNWFTSDTFSIVANACKIFTFMPVGKYIRLKYTNGATPNAPGAFFLCLQWRSTAVKPSSHRVQDQVTDEDDAELVKAVIAARHPDGHYGDIGADYAGSLNVAFGDTGNLGA